MTALNDSAGQAALTICESLLLALSERKILPESEIIAILKDAAATHEFVPDNGDSEKHAAVAALINHMIYLHSTPHRR
jgi:hypothetical protein